MTPEYANGQREAHRQVRRSRLLQDETAISHMVRDALRERNIEEAVAVLNAYGALLERRPQMVEDLPAIERQQWEVRVLRNDFT